MRAYAPELQGAQPAAVVTGVLGLLQGIPAEAPSLGWLRVCSFSGACVPACPEGLDPMMMVRVARMGAYGAMGAPAQLTDRDDPKFFRRINAFAQLQLSDAEIAQWHD